jgi:L-iditol 2-dehydrogenase
MRAVLLRAVGELVPIEMERPALSHADEVLVQVKAVGICGSEVHAYRGTHPFRKAPTVLGHEMAGVVVEVSAAVSGYKPGDRVFVDPQRPCGRCAYCQAGQINLCPDKAVLGTPAWPGAFGEYIVAPSHALFRLPERVSFVEGALVEPLTVAVHVARRAAVDKGEGVVILGSGSIGGLLAGVCHAWGADPIIAADIRRQPLTVAQARLGATHTVLLPQEDLETCVETATDGQGADVVFCTADEPSLAMRGLQLLRRRGRLLVVALMTQRPMELKAYRILSRELEVIGSTMSVHGDVREAIELAASGVVDVSAIATHVLPIEEAPRAIELAASKDDEAIKVVLTY